MPLLRLLVTIMLAFLSHKAISQVIVGKVQDSDNRPISNAYVTGSVAHAITNEHGYFKIRIVHLDTLEVSHVGYETIRIHIAPDTNTFIITLTPATIQLKPVTVFDYMSEDALKNKIVETPVIESEAVKNARENMLKTRILFQMGYRAPMTETEKFQHYLKGPQGFTFFSSSGGSIFKAIKNIIGKPSVSFKSFNRYSKPAGMVFAKDIFQLDSILCDSVTPLKGDSTFIK